MRTQEAFQQTIRAGEVFIDMDSPWEEIRGYRAISVGPSISARPSNDYLERQEPIDFEAGSRIFGCPYQQARADREDSEALAAWLVADLASNFLRSNERASPSDLVKHISSDPRCRVLEQRFIEGCLRCNVRRGIFEVWFDRRKQQRMYLLELSKCQLKSEEIRLFAGSFADELSTLSKRIKTLVRHASTVGTYREGLLQSLLRRHLPERYHVATGFILGCPRQIDVLIYDRIDYAPIFREGDLVVVPHQSVRAAVEVKTTLTSAELETSLELISEVAQMDDVDPPFFKGIFAFGSDLEAARIYDDIIAFHLSAEDDYIDTDDSDDGKTSYHHIITEPYKHVTCVCVQNLAFSFVGYRRHGEDNILTPMLMSRSSVSGLPAQASYFLQMLLSYLHYQSLKPGSGRELQFMLGADTKTEVLGTLTDFAEWGPYFVLSENVRPTGAAEVREAEWRIENVERWLEGESFQRPSSFQGCSEQIQEQF